MNPPKSPETKSQIDSPIDKRSPSRKFLDRTQSKLFGRTKTKLISKKTIDKTDKKAPALLDSSQDLTSPIYEMDTKNLLVVQSSILKSLNEIFKRHGMKEMPPNFIQKYHSSMYGTSGQSKKFLRLFKSKKDSISLLISF